MLLKTSLNTSMSWAVLLRIETTKTEIFGIMVIKEANGAMTDHGIKITEEEVGEINSV